MRQPLSTTWTFPLAHAWLALVRIRLIARLAAFEEERRDYLTSAYRDVNLCVCASVRPCVRQRLTYHRASTLCLPLFDAANSFFLVSSIIGHSPTLPNILRPVSPPPFIYTRHTFHLFEITNEFRAPAYSGVNKFILSLFLGDRIIFSKKR